MTPPRLDTLSFYQWNSNHVSYLFFLGNTNPLSFSSLYFFLQTWTLRFDLRQVTYHVWKRCKEYVRGHFRYNKYLRQHVKLRYPIKSLLLSFLDYRTNVRVPWLYSSPFLGFLDVKTFTQLFNAYHKTKIFTHCLITGSNERHIGFSS